MKSKLVLFLFLFFIISIHSSNVKFHNINDIYGTSIRQVYSICKDDYGFIWGASKTGILRISENSCHEYNLPHKTTDVFFTKLIYENSLLIAYSNNGQYFLYDRVYDRFNVFLDLRRSLNLNYVSAKGIIVNNDKSCWVGTSIGLYKYEKDVLKPALEKNVEIQYIAKFNEKYLFLATTNGIGFFNTKTSHLEYILQYSKKDEIQVSGFLYDKETNQLWIGTLSNGLLNYKIKEKQLVKPSVQNFPKQPILTITKNKTSSLLLGIDGQGVWELSADGLKVLNVYKEDVNDPFSLQGDGVYDILCDSNKRVWIATYTGGLLFFDKKAPSINLISHQINNSNSLVNNYVNKVLEDKRGNIWFATNNGISKWNPTLNEWKTYYQNKQEQSKVFLALCEDSKGNIWGGTYSSGVYVIDGKTGKEINHYFQEKDQRGISGKFVSSIFRDSQGDMWIGGTDNIIKYIEKEDQFRIYDKQPIYSFAELSPDSLLLACDYGLILMNKKSGKKEVLLADCLVLDILILGDNIWLGTSGDGLIQFNYKNGKIKRYTTDSGLISNYVNSIIFKNNVLWLGTESGLCQFDLRNEKILVYTSSIQIPSLSFNANSHWLLKNKNMIWGTNKGAIIFNPDSLYEDVKEGHIFIQDISISGISIREKKELLKDIPVNNQTNLTLKYDQNNFMLELLPMGISNDRIKISWKLEGLDSDWTQPSDLYFIKYANLSYGGYVLKIRMYDNSGLKIIDERLLNIEIAPPFWNKWWFRLIFLTVIAGVIAYSVKIYLNRLQQKHTKEKIRFFTNIAHDIRTSLTLINGPVEKLNTAPELSEESHYYLKLVTEQSDRLSSVATQLLDFQKVDIGKEQIFIEMTDIVKLVSQRCAIFKEIAEKTSIELVFLSKQESYITAVDNLKIEKVVDNLLSNAIKYSHPKSRINVTLICEVEKWILEVRDYGLGISNNVQNKLFKEFYRGENKINSKIVGSGIGLLLVKHYVLMHNGQVSLNSKENVGSSFKIVIPSKAVDGIESASLVLCNDEAEDKDVSGIDNASERKAHMLIVEDNNDLQEFLVHIFKGKYNILKADDGLQAWEIIKKQNPMLVISDIMMPNMDGFELCRLMKSTFETSHIPLVLLTSLSEKTSQLEGLGLGADDYITKPFDINILTTRIESILKNRESIYEKAFKLVNKTSSPKTIFTNELNDKFVKKAIEVVYENISKVEFGKDEFAFQLNVSPSLLYQKLKSLTGKSPIDFIRIIRFNRSLELLQTRKYTIGEISDICGFSSSSYFSTAFKKHFGTSPTEILD